MTKTELVFTAEQSEGQHRTMYVNISEEFPLWGCYSTTTQKAIIDSYITKYGRLGVKLKLKEIVYY